MIYYEDDACRLYLGDCLEILPQIEAVDHVITDPPYSEHTHAKQRRGGNRHRDGVVSEGRELGFASLDADTRSRCGLEFGRLSDRWTLVFSDSESAHLWRSDIAAEYIRTMFWRKAGGAPQFTGDRPAVSCEAITVCHPLGRKKWNGGGKQGFYDWPIVTGHSADGRYHTTQKPLGLIAELIADFTDEGDTILDPFAGSGTTGVAAKLNGRKAILIEREEKYCAVAAKRLRETEPGRLFDALKAKQQTLLEKP